MPSPTDRSQAPRFPRIPSAFSRRPSALSSRRAFTLTELLIVITIIAILAGLGSYAAVQALGTAKQTRIKTEVDAIDAAFKAYKEQYGSYPPCDLRITAGASVGTPGYNAVLKAHVARAFPRYDITQLASDLALSVDTKDFRPDQAVVFWLGGFSPDPTNPFNRPNGVPALAKAQRTPAFFNFDSTRLVVLNSNVNPWSGATQECPSYIPQGSKSNVPFVYYDGPTIMYLLTTVTPVLYWFDSKDEGLSAGICVPYSADPSPSGPMVNVDSFQIISAGTDGIYGDATPPAPIPKSRFYPSGTNYDVSSNFADDDNIANFCAKARLGDAKP